MCKINNGQNKNKKEKSIMKNFLRALLLTLNEMIPSDMDRLRMIM